MGKKYEIWYSTQGGPAKSGMWPKQYEEEDVLSILRACELKDGLSYFAQPVGPEKRPENYIALQLSLGRSCTTINCPNDMCVDLRRTILAAADEIRAAESQRPGAG